MSALALFDDDLRPLDLTAPAPQPFRLAPRPQLTPDWVYGWVKSWPGGKYPGVPTLRRVEADGFEYEAATFLLSEDVSVTFYPNGEQCLYYEGERLVMHEAVGRGLAVRMTAVATGCASLKANGAVK